MEKMLYWLHMVFSYIAPGLLLFYNFVIENILDKEVSLSSKLGASGIFALILCLIICIVFVNKLFTKKEQKYEKLSIKEIDLGKRSEYILKWTKTERNHSIFKQGLMLGVVITITFLVALLESKLLALRGTMTIISILFGLGLMFFVAYENYKLKKIKGDKVENKGQD